MTKGYALRPGDTLRFGPCLVRLERRAESSYKFLDLWVSTMCLPSGRTIPRSTLIVPTADYPLSASLSPLPESAPTGRLFPLPEFGEGAGVGFSQPTELHRDQLAPGDVFWWQMDRPNRLPLGCHAIIMTIAPAQRMPASGAYGRRATCRFLPTGEVFQRVFITPQVIHRRPAAHVSDNAFSPQES